MIILDEANMKMPTLFCNVIFESHTTPFKYNTSCLVAQ